MTAGKTVTELMESGDERVRLDAAKYYTARRMGWKETNVNEQVGKDGGPIDAKRKMIVEQAVTNDVLDMGLLQQTAEPARQILEVETIDVVADKGYFKSEDIEACEKAGLTPHVPRPTHASTSCTAHPLRASCGAFGLGQMAHVLACPALPFGRDCEGVNGCA